MTITRHVASRTTCVRRSVGAIIVKDRRILATGYNGVPCGVTHCDEVGCLRNKLKIPSGKQHELCRGLHAEQNAIIQAAKSGTCIDGSIMYSTTQPCIVCAKMIINTGILEVVYCEPYDDDISMDLLHEAGVKLRIVE